MGRKYKPPQAQAEKEPEDNGRRKVVIYYRQSQMSQVGNQSTFMQTTDMVDKLKTREYAEEEIILIDVDAGVSGTTGIDDREGLSELFYDYIETGEVGLIVVQAVDRLFRDWVQIDTNRFIDACLRNKVKVETQTMVYDFGHPEYGKMHVKMFRSEAEIGAAFIEMHIKGRLHPARKRRIQQGDWSGQGVPTGYMVDDRELGSNPDPCSKDGTQPQFSPFDWPALASLSTLFLQVAKAL